MKLVLAALIFTIAGTGTQGYSGDGRVATDGRLNHPRGIDVDPGGEVIWAEAFNDVVRSLDTRGTMRTAAGVGRPGFFGDGGPATRAGLNFAHGVAFLPTGGYLIADPFNQRIRRVSRGGIIRTVAGGRGGFCGDGGRAVGACLGTPRGIAAEKVRGGGFLIPDTDNRRIRRVRDGVIRTVAGPRGFRGPFAVSALEDGGFLVADAGAHLVRLVSRTGRVTRVAGTGRPGFSGDGGNAKRARLNSPHGVFALPDGSFLIADTKNSRVRLVSKSGRITTVVGSSRRGFTGDGGPPTRARLNQPKGIATTPDGGMVVADAENDAIRYIAPEKPSRLAVAVRGRIVRGRRGRAVDVPVVSTLDATVRVTVLSSAGRVVRSVTKAAAAGRTAVEIPAGLGPGRRRILVRARASGGRASTARSTLLVTG
jgi:streptogramin lyase